MLAGAQSQRHTHLLHDMYNGMAFMTWSYGNKDQSGNSTRFQSNSLAALSNAGLDLLSDTDAYWWLQHKNPINQVNPQVPRMANYNALLAGDIEILVSKGILPSTYSSLSDINGLGSTDVATLTTAFSGVPDNFLNTSDEYTSSSSTGASMFGTAWTTDFNSVYNDASITNDQKQILANAKIAMLGSFKLLYDIRYNNPDTTKWHGLSGNDINVMFSGENTWWNNFDARPNYRAPPAPQGYSFINTLTALTGKIHNALVDNAFLSITEKVAAFSNYAGLFLSSAINASCQYSYGPSSLAGFNFITSINMNPFTPWAWRGLNDVCCKTCRR